MAFPISAYGDHHTVVCFIPSFPGRRANNCFELRKYEAQEVSIGNTSRSKLPVLHTFVCVCVCVCVCLYSSTVKASSVCKMSKTYFRVRINDLLLWIFVDCVMPSSIIAVFENVILYLQRRKTPAVLLLERKRYDIMRYPRKDDIYWYRI